MSTPSFNDIEQISAYLDGELSQAQRARLIARIVKEPDLARAMEEMRQVRALVQQTPRRKVPRNFTLTRKMAGIRPPVPRLVPALSWASAVAMVLFICTLSFNFLAQGGFGAAAPQAADRYNGAAPATMAPAMAAPATAAPATAAPATAAPVAAETPTPALSLLVPATTVAPAGGGKTGLPTVTGPAATSEAGATRVFSAPPAPLATQQAVLQAPTQEAVQAPTQEVSNVTSTTKTPERRPFPWQYAWLGLAVILIGAALLIRWLNVRNFARRNKTR